MKKIALVGNPNCGKTSLFNSLTGCNSCVGNWSGVTSTSCRSLCKNGISIDYEVTDLPGCYGLTRLQGGNCSIVESNVNEQLSGGNFDLVVNVLDAMLIERQLYLTSQLCELHIPMIVVINRIDLLSNQKASLNVNLLRSRLGCPVYTLSTLTGFGLRPLKLALSAYSQDGLGLCNPSIPLVYPEVVESLLNERMATGINRSQALGALMSGLLKDSPPSYVFSSAYQKLLLLYPGGLSECIAVTRREWARSIVKQSMTQLGTIDSWTKWIDKWMLHRLWGGPLFILNMGLVFWLSMGLGQYLQSVVEPLFSFLFIDMIAWAANMLQLPNYLIIVLSEGLGLGLITSFCFLPFMSVVFLGFFCLEECGYMTRAAVLFDRLIKPLGLPGDALISLVMGFGCNVPGIMSVNHVKSKESRFVTTMMMPFMSCNARLAIYAVFCQAFFKGSSCFIMLFLYILGIGVALLTGILLKMLGYQSQQSKTYILDLPVYQWPRLRFGFGNAVRKSYAFVRQALLMIVPATLTLSLCAHFTPNGDFLSSNNSPESCLAIVSKFVASFFAFMIKKDSWPVILSLMMGFIAKEVVLSTLSLFYSDTLPDPGVVGDSLIDIFSSRLSEVMEQMLSLPSHILPFWQQDILIFPGLHQAFETPYHVMSYLIFSLLYFPCVSTLVAMSRQVGAKYAWMSVAWSFFIAYVCAWLFLRVCKPWIYGLLTASLVLQWVLIALFIGLTCWLIMRYRAENYVSG
ncbi:MAG: ferrous iron transport protein B [Pseudomonadota bacterium]|nr:ferrous iron transport protein B [Pseudomonadota bacterium]